MKSRRVKKQHGFTIMQMVITIAIIAIVSTFGVLGIRNARAEFRKQSSARLFASYIEKARADSVRRHAASGDEASVETFGAATTYYTVKMDFGSGTVETRTFQLDPGVDFLSDALKVTFDWRGRLITPCPVTKSCVYQVRSISLGTSIPVDVSGSGDITVDSQHFPDGSITGDDIVAVGNDDVNPDPMGTPAIEGTPTPDPVDGGGGVDPIDPVDPVDPNSTPTPTPTATPTATPTPTPHGNGNGGGNDGNNGNGGGNATPTPTPTTSGQCVATISPSTITISQGASAQQTGTAIFTMTASGPGARIITAAQDGNGSSLVIELSLSRIDGSGSSTISVTSKNGAGNRGQFSVKVSADPSCGSAQTLTVIVNN
jgi:type II secretory pathway pseudopilin PulG